MKEDLFVKQNSEAWSCLEQTLLKLKSKGFHKLEKNELNNFMLYYNRTCGHLSYCRTNYGNTATTAYLNKLVASAHSYIYTKETSSFKKLVRFFLIEFPLLVKQNIKPFTISTALFFLGFFLSFIYTALFTENAAAFLPKEVLDKIDFGGSSSKSWNGSLMSSYILTNNIKVGFMAFSFGITLGIGTTYVLIFNGFMLGTIAALAFDKGINLKFWSLILPHGIFELFAIFVCGAAGLIIGYSLIYPGIYSRKDSFIIKGKLGIKLVCGTIPIFVVAGLIEGFITPMNIPEVAKLTFAFFTLIFLLFYVIYPHVKFKKAEK